MDEEALKLLLARGVSIEQIAKRFDRDPSTVSYWMRKYGLQAPNHEKYAARGAIGRERLAELDGEGRSIAEIAEEVQRSKGTVRHWLGKYGLSTTGTRRRAVNIQETDDGELIGSCERHGETRFWRTGDGRLRCLACRQAYVVTRRRTVKQILLADAGGRCVICGYDRYAGALHFHHRRRDEKLFGLSEAGLARSLERARTEARKCVLLCSNCHAEVESGVAELPIEYGSAVDPGGEPPG